MRCHRQARREVEVRRRVAAANAWARLHPERTLGRRTRAALPVLLRGAGGAGQGRVGELLEACEALEVATRQSAVCCAMVADRAALPILVTFIRSCNRSQPHMQLVRMSPALGPRRIDHPGLELSLSIHRILASWGAQRLHWG